MPRRTIAHVVRDLCLSFPEAQEVTSHGMSNFRVRGKIFAVFALNHHGDGRIALWLNAPAGAQTLYVREEPRHFFIPPYVGQRGWLGVRLDRGIAWERVARLVREAYEKMAPAALSQRIKAIRIRPPTAKIPREAIDPFASKRAQAVLKSMRLICLDWPETSEGRQFGHPVWRVGKKVFARLLAREGQRLGVAFWVGLAQQGLFTVDPRYSVPPYIGRYGWIELDVTKSADWKVVASLLRASYRHYASKRIQRLMELPLI
jgi:predicted DNA-binding protein (MmcQ/YjbR family)